MLCQFITKVTLQQINTTKLSQRSLLVDRDMQNKAGCTKRTTVFLCKKRVLHAGPFKTHCLVFHILVFKWNSDYINFSSINFAREKSENGLLFDFR